MPEESNYNHRNSRTHMRIDNVLSTQPELGPSVPDGGYGWVILIATSYYQLALPSISIAYGLFLLFSSMEYVTKKDQNLWDNAMLATPLCYITVYTIIDPICRMIIATSKWPRLVVLSGVSLTCAGILLLWLGIVRGIESNMFLYIFGGIFSGIGSALTLTQCEILITQYFRLKLFAIQTILWLFLILGFIFTPIFLGKTINHDGLPHAIMWYHLYILIGILVCLLLHKPDYLKHNYVSTIHYGPEEDIFSKNTELKNARTSNKTTETILEFSNPEQSTSASANVEQIHTSPAPNNWETFTDDEDTENTPKELFTEIHVNNNTTYAFDNIDVVDANDDANIFVAPTVTNKDSYDFLIKFSFYKVIILQISLKYSAFCFYTIFPNYFYMETENIHKESILRILSFIFSSCVLLIVLLRWFTFSDAKREIAIAIISGLCGTGYFIITGFLSVGAKIFGGIMAILCLHSLEHISEPLLKMNVKSVPNKIYIFHNLLSGCSFAFLFIFNFTYLTYMHIVALLHFLNCSLWVTSFICKKMYA